MLGNLFGSGGGKGGGYINDPFGTDAQFGGMTREWNTDMPLPKRGPFDAILDRSSDRYSGGYSGRSNPFSGENALQGFKSLLDVSNAMEDENRKKSMNTFGNFGDLFSRSSGTGGMQLSSGPFGTTTYFPDSSSQGYGGTGGEGKKPSRFAKVASGAASGFVACGGNPICAAVGGIGGLFS